MIEAARIAAAHQLAPTLGPLLESADGVAVRSALDRLSSLGFRFVQLSATLPGLRARDLDQSARRDLLATLRRRELTIAGIDLWIPPSHFLESSHADRAISTVLQTIELAADLERVPVSMTLPKPDDDSTDAMNAAIAAITGSAERHGVQIADHAVPITMREGPIGIGIDPAAWLAQRSDPAAAILAHPDQIISVRLTDLLTSGMRGPIGNRHEQQLDLTQYSVAISVAHYARPIVLDARNWIEPWQGIEQSKGAWARQHRA